MHTGNGEEVLKIIYRKPPPLLILNIMMPRKTGDEVLRGLSKSGVEFPILFITGCLKSKEQAFPKLRIPAESFEFMTKPFTVEKFLSEVEALIST